MGSRRQTFSRLSTSSSLSHWPHVDVGEKHSFWETVETSSVSWHFHKNFKTKTNKMNPQLNKVMKHNLSLTHTFPTFPPAAETKTEWESSLYRAGLMSQWAAGEANTGWEKGGLSHWYECVFDQGKKWRWNVSLKKKSRDCALNVSVLWFDKNQIFEVHVWKNSTNINRSFP